MKHLNFLIILLLLGGIQGFGQKSGDPYFRALQVDELDNGGIQGFGQAPFGSYLRALQVDEQGNVDILHFWFNS